MGGRNGTDRVELVWSVCCAVCVVLLLVSLGLLSERQWSLWTLLAVGVFGERFFLFALAVARVEA